MSVLTDTNISVKEFNKIRTYKDVEIKIDKMWYLKTINVPVIVGALGMTKKGSDRHINKIPVNPSLYEKNAL